MCTVEEIKTYTKEQYEQMEIAMNNCYLIFDPYRTMPREKLIDLVDSTPDYNYYVTLFISNTCDLLQDNDKITVEMISKLGKYLREIKAKPKRERIFTEHCNNIRELALSFTPLLENPDFLKIWGTFIEYALEQKKRDIEDGTYEKELELIQDENELNAQPVNSKQDELEAQPFNSNEDDPTNDNSLKNNQSIIIQDTDSEKTDELSSQFESLSI